MLEFARELAAQAASMLAEAHEKIEDRTVDQKGRRDLVTDVDRNVEAFLTEQIARRFPDDAILAEETVRKPGRSGRGWIVDPLDGTTNFVHGHPMFCVSIALAKGYVGIPDPKIPLSKHASGYFPAGDLPRLLVGVVAAPALREVFWASRGKGAWLGERRLGVSDARELGDALVATGFAYRRNELSNNNLNNFNRLAMRVRGIRRGGSAALDLCYVAAGRFAAFWELYLKPWDVAAGMLLVEEAGGHVTDFAGGKRGLEGIDILASNGKLHEQVRELLEGPDPEWAQGERGRLV